MKRDQKVCIFQNLSSENRFTGEWSGLRIDLSTRTDLSLTHEVNGIRLQINHPNQWPNSASFVPAGSATYITIKPTFSYTTEDVRRLHPDQRQCLNVIIIIVEIIQV